MLSGHLLSHYTSSIAWTGRYHMVTEWEKKLKRVPCFLPTNLTFPDKKKQSKFTFLACAFHLLFSWMGRKEGAQYQRRNIPETAGSRAPTHSTANAVLLQQEARTQVCYKVPIASLSSCCPHNIALCVNSLYFENCSFSQQNCELNGEEFCPFNSSLQVRERVHAELV